MKYINQNKYPHIPYRTRAKVEGLTDEQRTTNVAESGCGLCCACMAVDYLTDKTLTIEECVRLSEECVANHSPGTDLKFLGPAVAEKFGLDVEKAYLCGCSQEVSGRCGARCPRQAALAS